MRAVIGFTSLAFGLSILIIGCGKTDGLRANLSGKTPLPTSNRGGQKLNNSPIIQKTSTKSYPLEIGVSDVVEGYLRVQFGSNFTKSDSCFISDIPLAEAGARVYYYNVSCRNLRRGMVEKMTFNVFPLSVAFGEEPLFELSVGRNRVGLVSGHPSGSRGHVLKPNAQEYELIEMCGANYPCFVHFKRDRSTIDSFSI
jgi:hypothetical protein